MSKGKGDKAYVHMPLATTAREKRMQLGNMAFQRVFGLCAGIAASLRPKVE